MADDLSEIFTVKARRCKRCGGLLTSAEALKDGYGHVCRMKTREEELAKIPGPNQITLFENLESEDE
ncbi:MAG: hypothetical protein LUE24_01920 [Lachnospiraceae bacterium]|nr:hypothetical protein [Lachnospiraceae bacterium]